MAKAAKKTASKSAGKSAPKAAASKPAASKKAKAAKASSGPQGETDLVRRVAQKKVAKNTKIQDFGAGDTVGVYVKVREGDKERIQLYKGVCIKVQGEGVTRNFTVRKISAGVGVERTFPFRSPSVDRVDRKPNIIRAEMRSYQKERCTDSRLLVAIENIMAALDRQQRGD